MRMNQLQYVLEIAKCQSFSNASKKLLIAQPTLSSAISALEEELGFPIFKRTPRGAFLTEEGLIVHAQAEQILAAVEQIGDITRNTLDHYTISIAATPTACNGLITNLSQKVSHSHPGIQLNVIETRPSKELSPLENGMVDIVVGFCTDRKKCVLETAAKNNYHVEPVLKDFLYVYVSRNHPLAQKESVYSYELNDYRQAMFQDYFFIGEKYEEIAHLVSCDNCYIYSDRSSIKQAVAVGLAYAIFPQQMALDDIYVNSGMIKAIPLADQHTEIITYLAWNQSSYVPTQKTVVIDCLRELYKETAQRLEKMANSQREKTTESAILRY